MRLSGRFCRGGREGLWAVAGQQYGARNRLSKTVGGSAAGRHDLNVSQRRWRTRNSFGVVEVGCRAPGGAHQLIDILLTGRTPLLNAVRRVGSQTYRNPEV